MVEAVASREVLEPTGVSELPMGRGVFSIVGIKRLKGAFYEELVFCTQQESRSNPFLMASSACAA